MKKMYLWKQAKFLLLSFFGSLLISLLGFLALPELMQYVRIHMDKQIFLWVCFFLVFLACSILFLGETSYMACKFTGAAIYKNRRVYYRRIWAFLVAAAAIYLIASLLDGLIAVFIHHIFAGSMTFERHKLIIDLIISQMTLLVMPVIIVQLFAFSLYNRPFFQTIRLGFSALQFLYLRLLLAMIVLFVFGALMGLVASWMDNDSIRRIWLLLGFGLEGTLATIFTFQVGLQIFVSRTERLRRRIK